MKRFKGIIIAAVVLALGAAIYGYLEFSRTHSSLTGEKPVASLEAAALIAEFTTDEAAANGRYLDKVLEVSGSLADINDANGTVTLTLSPGDGAGSIQCEMDSTFAAQAKSLENGTQVRIKGICSGFMADELLGSDVILNRCVLSE